MAKWETNEMTRMHGPVLLRAWRGCEHGDATWYASVHLHTQGLRVYANPAPEVIGYACRADAQRALDAYAKQLGPVEPALALVRYFGAVRGHVRARRAA